MFNRIFNREAISKASYSVCFTYIQHDCYLNISDQADSSCVPLDVWIQPRPATDLLLHTSTPGTNAVNLGF